MKNITISVPDEVYRQARVWAAQHGTSLSATVGRLLALLPETPIVRRMPAAGASKSSPLQREETALNRDL